MLVEIDIVIDYFETRLDINIEINIPWIIIQLYDMTISIFPDWPTVQFLGEKFSKPVFMF